MMELEPETLAAIEDEQDPDPWIAYILLNIRDGSYIPRVDKHYGVHANVESTSVGVPRLFWRKGDAKSALHHWLKADREHRDVRDWQITPVAIRLLT